MNKLKILIAITILFSFGTIRAQEVLSLDSCRARALRYNLGLKQAEMKVAESAALEKVALWQMLPKVSANGGYMWMQKSVNLLSEEQKDNLNHLGDNVQGDIQQALHEELSDLPIGGDLLADRLSNVVSNSNLIGSLNGVGNDIVQALETDTRNMSGAMVSISQPIYMGGKLVAMHRTAQLTQHLSGVQLTQKQQQTLLEVDEAYWQVVSLEYKQRLATQYEALLDTLEHHVELLLEAQMATKGDLAQVRVKHNEAEMSLTKADNGLRLSKMLLAERCGMPLDSEFLLQSADHLPAVTVDTYTSLPNQSEQESAMLRSVYERRTEMQMLRIADSIATQGVHAAASVLKPNIAVNGGYLLTNPNVFDGFSNTWGGTFLAGVVVNVPLVHPAGIYAIKAAKAKRQEVRYQMEEAQEMIALQVKKLDYELQLAYKHLAQAESDLESAEDNLELADQSFAAGMCSSSDLMSAQTAWMKAKSEVIDARIEVEMGHVYLNQALGY